MSSLQAGQMLGPYRIIGQIGQGGMATVYRAYHAAMNRDVAIKVLPRQLAESSEFSARFHQEALTIAGLEHPHILPVYDHGEADEVPYLVMRCLDAGTLKDRLEAGRLPLKEIDRLFSQLADALDYAHARGVIHRDLKPSNALLDQRGNLFLADFGIAKLLESDKHFTSTGALVGTPVYMSPEQAQGLKVDARTDIYSLGIILYEMVTGQVPFEAETPLAVILKHINEPLPLPSSVYPGTSAAVERVILKALSKDPQDRFASVADFLAAWKQALSQQETVRGPQALAQAAAKTVISDAHAPTLVNEPGPPAEAAASTALAEEKAPSPRRKPKGALFWVLGGAVLLAALALLVGGGVLLAGLLTAREQSQPPGPQAPQTPISVSGGPAWRSWTAVSSALTLAVDDEQVYSGDWHGLTVWDRSSGEFSAHYGVAEGLPEAFVNDLMIHPDEGNLWVATDGGLAQQTEQGWVIYDTSDGLDSPAVMAIESTQHGLLAGTAYSGEAGGGLNRLGGNGWEPFPGFPSGDAPALLSWNVNTVRAWENGEVWVGTANGLGHYHPESQTWEAYFMEDGLPDNEIRALLADGPGQAWVATVGGVVRFIDGSFETVPQMDEIGVDFSDGMWRDERGWYWFATYDGIYRFNPDNADWTMFPDEDLGVNYLTGIAEDEDGLLYFGSENGLIVYDGEDLTPWRVPNVPQVWGGYERILAAPDGALWFAGRSMPQTDRFDPASESWSLLGELPWDYLPLAVDAQGNTWCLEWGEGLHRLGADGTVITWTTAEGLPSNEIYSLAVAPNGTAWVGTRQGLAQIENDQVVETYHRGNLLPQDAAYLVFAASDGSVWVYTADDNGLNPSLSRRDAGGQWAHYGGGRPFHPDWDGVSAMAEDANGVVWVAANGDALFKFEQGQWLRRSLPGEDSWFTALEFAPDGSLWVGTGDAGAYRWDGAAWQHYGVKEGLIYPEIRDIHVAADGTVWFATVTGVTRYIP